MKSINPWKLPPIRVGTLRPKRILAPVDFTECSQKAVTYAVSLAKHFNSEIILLHISKLATVSPAPEFAVLQTDVLNEQARESAVRQLGQWRDRVAVHVPVRMQVRVGVSTQEEIVDAARKTDCDLIVMATHVKGALEHLFTGSVTEKVVQHAPCPVFVVREREHDFLKPKTTRRRALVMTE
ncbi:MAG TPA: universal stress protein [Verrucomicrobiae bacterium]|jgi:nucleotide-binding universal stress UspA family protein|nr:universal stress protein [Verrucomicrobiae bacterium]